VSASALSPEAQLLGFSEWLLSVFQPASAGIAGFYPGDTLAVFDPFKHPLFNWNRNGHHIDPIAVVLSRAGSQLGSHNCVDVMLGSHANLDCQVHQALWPFFVCTILNPGIGGDL